MPDIKYYTKLGGIGYDIFLNRTLAFLVYIYSVSFSVITCCMHNSLGVKNYEEHKPWKMNLYLVNTDSLSTHIHYSAENVIDGYNQW